MEGGYVKEKKNQTTKTKKILKERLNTCLSLC